jgi:hypothetical protein
MQSSAFKVKIKFEIFNFASNLFAQFSIGSLSFGPFPNSKFPILGGAIEAGIQNADHDVINAEIKTAKQKECFGHHSNTDHHLKNWRESVIFCDLRDFYSRKLVFWLEFELLEWKNVF